MSLSIVLTCLSDTDLPNTVRSIQETAVDSTEIIVVFDGPQIIPRLEGIKPVVNEVRCGVGPSRFIGLQHANGDYVLIGDSHLRFKPGWLEPTLHRLQTFRKSLYCFCCAGLDRDHMDVNHPVSKYYAASLNFYGPDPNDKGKMQFLEPNWLKSKPEDNAQIPCVLGGCYAASTEWMLKVARPLKYLRGYGEDEATLSIRSYSLGGNARIMTEVEVGHRFLARGEKQPYTVAVGLTSYNKLFTIQTLAAENNRDFLLNAMLLSKYAGGELSTGRKMLEQNWALIESERAQNQREFVQDYWKLTF